MPAVANLLRGVAARVGRMARRGPVAAPVPGLTPAQLARRRQVAALRRRQLTYAPELDGQADPGEIVWTWVPYEEDHSQGKDRPVLVVGRNGTTLLGLMMSSSAARDGQDNWYALGPGPWDREERPSWVRMDRVLRVKEHGIRREGAVLSRARFDALSKQLRMHYGWQ